MTFKCLHWTHKVNTFHMSLSHVFCCLFYFLINTSQKKYPFTTIASISLCRLRAGIRPPDRSGSVICITLTLTLPQDPKHSCVFLAGQHNLCGAILSPSSQTQSLLRWSLFLLWNFAFEYKSLILSSFLLSLLHTCPFFVFVYPSLCIFPTVIASRPNFLCPMSPAL